MTPAPARRRRSVGTIVASAAALGALVLAMELSGPASLPSDTTGSLQPVEHTGSGSCNGDRPPKDACVGGVQVQSGREAPVRRAGENITAEEHHAPAEVRTEPGAAAAAPEPAAASQAAAAEPAADVPPRDPSTIARPGARKARVGAPPTRTRPAVADRDIMSGRNEN